VAESWPAAAQKADILDTLVKEYHPHSQSATFEQAITLGSSSSHRGKEGSQFSQQQATQTPQFTQPIPARRRSATIHTQDSIFSGSFSSSYSDAPWQPSPSYTQHQTQLNSFQDGVDM